MNSEGFHLQPVTTGAGFATIPVKIEQSEVSPHLETSPPRYHLLKHAACQNGHERGNGGGKPTSTPLGEGNEAILREDDDNLP